MAHTAPRIPAGLLLIWRTDGDIVTDFLPRPVAHRLIAGADEGAGVVCGSVRFGIGGANPLSDSLPDVVLVELANLRGAGALLDLMSEEAFTPHSGAQAAHWPAWRICACRKPCRACAQLGFERHGRCRRHVARASPRASMPSPAPPRPATCCNGVWLRQSDCCATGAGCKPWPPKWDMAAPVRSAAPSCASLDWRHRPG